jgi:hypothetical protein
LNRFPRLDQLDLFDHVGRQEGNALAVEIGHRSPFVSLPRAVPVLAQRYPSPERP